MVQKSFCNVHGALKPLLPLLVPQDELYLPEEDTAKAFVDCQEGRGRRPQLFPF